MSSSAFDISTRLSDLVETTLKDGPQIVTKDGKETAVLVPIDVWKKTSGAPVRKSGRTLKQILLDPNGPHDIVLPPRGSLKRRPPFRFED